MNNKCITYEKSFLFHFPHVNKKESDNSYSHDSQILLNILSEYLNFLSTGLTHSQEIVNI